MLGSPDPKVQGAEGNPEQPRRIQIFKIYAQRSWPYPRLLACLPRRLYKPPAASGRYRFSSSPDRQVAARAKRTLRNRSHLFTFLSHEGVEPTNNVAERGLRPAVQWRKLCFGNQSENGERFTEGILTVTRTCRFKGKNPFHFLSDLMEAAFQGTSRPSLLS